MYRHGALRASFNSLNKSNYCQAKLVHPILCRPYDTRPPTRIQVQARRALHGQNHHDGVLQQFKQSLSFHKATCEINAVDVAPKDPIEVVLHGYLGAQTVLSKQLCFVPLFSRDLTYCVQIVSATNKASESKIKAHASLLNLPAHTPVAVTGVLKARDAPTEEKLGDAIKMTSRELELRTIQPLNNFPADIIMKSDVIFPPEQRHLQLRQEKGLRDALRMRDSVASICRNRLHVDGFVEIETPILFKKTPEGAREFVVPTRRPGLGYALPQSPQQYKQILMSSGISRYFQMARCFRDEDLRADRQPEFTQLDLEMSFASGEDVIQLVEPMIREIWALEQEIELVQNFPRLTYHQAMAKFGTDKPDTRLGMEISRLGHLLPVDLVRMISDLSKPIVEGFLLPLSQGELDGIGAKQFIAEFMDSPAGEEFRTNPCGAPGVFVFDSSKPMQGLQALGFEAAEEVERIFEPTDGDVIILQARSDTEFTGGSTILGNLRQATHRAAVAKGHLEAPTGWAPLWVTDFPLFSAASDIEPGQGGSAGLVSTHHPFTSPKTPDDVDILTVDPSKAIADHYDLVINGVEIGGGSRRIHNAAMQRFIMEDILQMSPGRIGEFSHMLEALRAGCPPHAGIALGYDRLIAVLMGRDSLRDVIAFPKSNRGEDVLVRSPSPMGKDTLDMYHIQLKEGDE